MAREQRRLAAVLAADAVGYSRLMGQDEGGTLARLKAHRSERLEPALGRNGGRLVKLTGDGALAEFGSAVDALRAAIEFQQAVFDANRHLAENRQIVFRIGLHLGDLIVDGDDLYGDGVNVAARLEGQATSGGILLSGDFHNAVNGKVNATFQDLGPIKLKNIDRPVQAFRVNWDAGDWKTTPAIQAAPSVEGLLSPAGSLPVPDKPSIAVLPFQNMSGDSEQEYFADGLVEDIITALSRVRWFFVIARNSSFVYKGKSIDIRQVGRELGVRYVIEGSVRKAGNRIRLTVQLIEAASGDHLWADRYDGALEQVFELQDQVVEKLIGAVEPKLRSTEIARARRKRPDSMDAFDLLLQALPKQATMTGKGFGEAIELLDRAIALDPYYAQALGNAAWCRAMRPFHGLSPDPVRDRSEASALARRALEADPEDPMALRTVATTIVIIEKDYRTSFDLLDKSLAIDPNSAFAWNMRGWTHIWAGQADQAIDDLSKALRLSPFDSWACQMTNGMAFALNLAGRPEEALGWARRCMQQNPEWSASHRQIIGTLSLLGRDSEAREAAAQYMTMDPNFSVRFWAETGPFRRTVEQEAFFGALRRAGLPA